MDHLDLGATIKGLSAGQQLFGRYTLQKMLGRGGMGVVWLARDGELGRDTALKFLPEIVAADRVAIEELKREVRRAIDLAHPHIVKIHDFVSDGRTAAVSMEYIAGDTLASLRLDQPGQVFAPTKLEPWVRQLCAALDYAHQDAQVVHRDLKPANLMVDGRGRLKVLDFGLAASLAESVSRVSRLPEGSGTPAYMSPQQLKGQDPSVADDLYALGATLYELLAGQPPFKTAQASVLMHQVLNETPQPVNQRREKAGQPPVPPEWEQTVMALLSKDPKDRPQSAGEVADRLGIDARRTSGGARPAVGSHPRAPFETPSPAVTRVVPNSREPDRVRRSYLPIVAGVALLLAAVGGWYFGLHRPEQARLAEIRRLEALARTEADARERVRLEAEALKLKTEQERTSAEADRLANARGGIVIRTNPPGAEVRVGALALEKSPLTLKDQKLGRYPVRILMPGYEEWSGEIEVKENEFADLDIALVRSTGRVVITGTPGASVVNVGKDFGTIPLTLEKVPVGTVRFTISAKGFKPMEVSGEVARNSELRLNAALEKQLGPETGQRWTLPDLRLEMLPISAGTFQMGSSSSDQNDERPVTRVTISRPFWLGKTEVTQAQWEMLMGTSVRQQKDKANPEWPMRGEGSDHPMYYVSWTEAMEFCQRLTQRERLAGRLPEGYEYTLPTEAQWEYACRAGSTGDYAGNMDAMGWYGQNSGSATKPVGQKQANAWGLHDMHGNVWEWCSDWYGNYPGGTVTDPTGAPSGSDRVIRGGSWGSSAAYCRSARRIMDTADYRRNNLGFRLALSSVR